MSDYREISDQGRLPPDPKVSVIVMTYNHEDCLAEAVDGIATQKTAFPFDIIIAEDCSTDGTRAVAEALQEKYPDKVRVVFTDANKGMNRNLRFALSLARAAYLAFCEGDDFWLDDGKLQRQVTMLDEAPNVDLAITNGVLAHEDGRREEKPEWDYGAQPRIVPAKELFSGFSWVTPTASLVWRSEITRNLPAWLDAVPFADMPLMIAGSARGGAAYDPRPAVAYRRSHAASFTERLRNSSPQERADYALLAAETLRRSCEDFGMPVANVGHRIADYRLMRVRELAAAGLRARALSELVRISPRFLLAGAVRRLGRSPGKGKPHA